MRSVIYGMMISLDGYVARPNGDIDWHTVDEELHTFINNMHREFGAHLYGRRTYEMMAAAWPAMENDPSTPAYLLDFVRIWKPLPKVVFSRTLEHVEWNSRLVREDIAGEVEALKRQPGGDMAVGGPTLAASFLDLGLIDRVDLFVSPVVLGSGVPLFPGSSDSLSLTLVDSRTFDSGVVYLQYRQVS